MVALAFYLDRLFIREHFRPEFGLDIGEVFDLMSATEPVGNDEGIVVRLF